MKKLITLLIAICFCGGITFADEITAETEYTVEELEEQSADLQSKINTLRVQNNWCEPYAIETDTETTALINARKKKIHEYHTQKKIIDEKIKALKNAKTQPKKKNAQ